MIGQKFEQNESQAIGLVLACKIPQEFTTFYAFFVCFQKLFYEKIAAYIFLILLMFFIGFLNLLVVVLLLRKRAKMTLFDKLIISLCLCDFVIGVFDGPFYSISQMFAYWPLDHTLGMLWTMLDSGINTVNMSCMLHMTYVRLRSIQAPNTFEREFLIRKPFWTCVVYWIISYIIWIAITIGFGTAQFSVGVNFQPYYLAPIFQFFLYFLPLAIIIFLGFYLVILLYIRNRKKKNRQKLTVHFKNQTTGGSVNSKPDSIRVNRRKKLLNYIRKFFHFGPQTKFQIIIISYWVQWLPSFLICIFNPFCQCVPEHVVQGIYWMTFTASLTNPITVLIFNPNVAVSKTNLVGRVHPI